jgi:hypothetical protein
MRIGLIGDTHGSVPALEAALAGCRGAGADVVVHCGDFLSTPFSPDPPGETIALLRREGVRVVLGNGEVYLRDWGTPRWERTLAQRRRRPDSPDFFLPYVAAGQAELSADDLAWLRAAPEELTLAAARPGDVYVCHAMPGDPFSTPWDTDPRYTPAFTADELDGALSRPGVAGADLILCGHVPGPLAQRISLPNGRTALVIRGSHGVPGAGGSAWIDYHVLEPVGPVAAGYAAWEISRRLAPYRPRDPTWTWDQPSRRGPTS